MKKPNPTRPASGTHPLLHPGQAYLTTLAMLIAALIILTLSGCAAMQTGYEKPVVTLSSFEAIPGKGIIPKFKIGLHIINPNRSQLTLKGVSYTIALEGHNIMTGVSNDLPQIEPYGEGDVELTASVDLFSSIGFLTTLIQDQKRETLAYDFKAKLDAGTFHPLIRINKKGSLSLSGTRP